MSHDHDHHDEPAPELKDFIPFFLIACAVFAIGSCSITQSGLKKRASEELGHESGYEQVAVAIKGNKAILSGYVETAQQKEDAEDLLSTVEGLAGIAENNIEIGLPEPSEAVTAEPDNPTVAHHGEEPHAATPAEQAAPQALINTPHAEQEDTAKHVKADAHATPADNKPGEATSAANPEKSENPWVAELVAQPGRSLIITAIVTSHTSNSDFISHARKRLAEIKQAITADERISDARVRTYLQADLTDQARDSSTRYSFTFKD